MKRSVLWGLAALAILTFSNSASATTWKVGRGFNSCDGPCDFDDNSVGGEPRDGIERAMVSPLVQPGDTVLVWPGDYGQSPIPMKSGVLLTALNGLGSVTISGQGNGAAAISMSGTSELTVIEEMEVTWNALAGGVGGGIAALVASGTVRNCIFRNCKAGIGAGVYQQLSDVRLENNLFIDNEALSAGGVIAISTADPVIINNTFSGSINPFGFEGATVYSVGGAFEFDRNIVIGSQGGAAIYCISGSSPSFTCNIFYDNDFGAFSSGCADSSGGSGNLTIDPLICNLPAENFGVCADSPAVTGPCGPIGYVSPTGNCPNCQPTSVSATLEAISWGATKAYYR